MSKVPILLVALVVALSGKANLAKSPIIGGDPAATKFVGEYLSHLKSEKTAVFYGECHLKEGGKAAIVIPIGAKEGLYIESESDNTVANTADLTWANGQWQTEVTQGGVYTITRANNLIGEILGYSFQLIMPDKLDVIRTSKPSRVCVEHLP